MNVSASVAERLLERGDSAVRAFGVSAITAKLLGIDTDVRHKHHQKIGNKDFDNRDLSTNTIKTGLSYLLKEELEEPYGLELGHIINMHPHHALDPKSAHHELKTAQAEALDLINDGSLRITEPMHTEPSFRSALVKGKGPDVTMGWVKQPVADIYRDDIRVETHLRTSYGVVSSHERSNSSESVQQDVRTLLENYEACGMDKSAMPELIDNDGSSRLVFPVSTALIGLRRAYSSK